jgi:histidinol-phosphate aminotransferase
VRLRQAIGARFGLDPERIGCGAGSDDVIFQLCLIYGGPGTELVMTEHGFSIYAVFGRAAGCRVRRARERNLTADVDAILAEVTPATRLVVLANPNNPTGTYLNSAEVRRLHAGLPGGVLLVLDGAYAEYVNRNDYEAGIELAATTPNTVMTRTFSKIFGLAAARVGWAYAPAAVAQALNQIRSPFNLAQPSVEAAIAALDDKAHLEEAQRHNSLWRDRVTRELREIGFDVPESVGNFVLIPFGSEPGRTAQDADAYLNSKRIILRQLVNYKLPKALRMTIGLEEENRAALDALREFMKR